MNKLHELSKILLEHNQTVTCAESCTGGLLGGELTRLSGSSAWFNMGFITYSNAAKQQLLGVMESTLKSFGAVSEQTVREMALGALLAAKADWAVSISGVAGPTGGRDDLPVGTVWFGIASKQRIWAERKQFSGSRDEVRQQSVDYAIDLLYEKCTANLRLPENH